MLGAVFAIAAAGKLRSRAAFDAFVDSIPAPRGVTGDWLVGVAAAVIALELAAVVLLIVRPLAGLAVASGLLVAFTAVMIAVLRAGAAMVCRCFGADPRPVGRGHVARNAILISASLAGVVLHGTAVSGRSDPGFAVTAMTIGIAAILGVLVTRWDDLVFLFRPAGSPLTAAGEARRS